MKNPYDTIQAIMNPELDTLLSEAKVPVSVVGGRNRVVVIVRTRQHTDLGDVFDVLLYGKRVARVDPIVTRMWTGGYTTRSTEEALNWLWSTERVISTSKRRMLFGGHPMGEAMIVDNATGHVIVPGVPARQARDLPWLRRTTVVPR